MAAAQALQEVSQRVLSTLALLGFFLQRQFDFDFRRDGLHLVGFRTLPVSPLAVVIAEVAFPTMLCLAFQALGAGILMVYARPGMWASLMMILFFPAISLAINGVWNAYYLGAATKRAAGKTEAASAVGMVMMVALSFAVFFPAIFAARYASRHWSDDAAWVAAIAMQYGVDILLVLAMVYLFKNFEVSRDT